MAFRAETSRVIVGEPAVKPMTPLAVPVRDLPGDFVQEEASKCIFLMA